jgi:hypothetical protein
VHDSLLQLLKTNGIMSSSTVFQVRFWSRFSMWSCVQTHRHKTVHGWITNDCNLTIESCTTSLQSNKMSTRALYTPRILHTLHTRPGIDSVKGGNTHTLNVESRCQPLRSTPTQKAVHTHKQNSTCDKVSTLYTTHSSNQLSKQMVSCRQVRLCWMAVC